MSHIQFADDTLLFVNNDSHSWFMVEISNLFCQKSGLKDQYGKKVSCRTLIVYKKKRLVVGGKVGTLHIWVPLGGNPIKISFQESV